MIAPETLRKAQLIMLDMLIEFDALCKKHQLQYWMDSGTLLGAVRHKGFIPWDDDIDLSMPLEDYQKFLSVADELSDEIFVQNQQSDTSFKLDFTKLRSNRGAIVEFHEKGQTVDYHQGLFVDIFPMLAIEHTVANKAYYDRALAALRAASAITINTPDGEDDPAARALLTAALKEKHRGWEQQHSKVIYSGEMPDVAAWFDQEAVFPLVELEFEGLQFLAPNDPSHYLDAIYSFDYRQLPPEEMRKIHAHSITFT